MLTNTKFLPMKTSSIWRKFFAIIFLITSVQFAQAQTYDTEIDFGLRVKYLRATRDFKSDFGGTNSFYDDGVQLGTFLQLRVNHFYFQPELVFSHVQTRIEEPQVDQWENVALTVDFNSIELPLFLGYRTNLGSTIFRIGGAPILSYNLSVNAKLTTTTTNRPGPVLVDGFEDAFDDFTLHSRFGVGLDRGPFILDLMYERGLSKLYEEVIISGQGREVVRQHKWIIGLGYKLFAVKR